MATNNQLFDSLTTLLSHYFNSQEDVAIEHKEELKIHCIEQIQEDRRLDYGTDKINA